MLVTTIGWILQTTRFKESSLIVKLFTKEHGIQTVIVSGLKTYKSSFKPSTFQLLNEVEIVYYQKQNLDLYRLKEVKLVQSPISLSDDFKYKSIILYIVELLNKTISHSPPDGDMYYFIEQTIQLVSLNDVSISKYLPLYFIMNLCYKLGFSPLNNFETQMPYFDVKLGMFSKYETIYNNDVALNLLIHNLLKNRDITNLLVSAPDVISRSAVIDIFLKYLQYHVHGFNDFSSLNIIRELIYD